MVHKARLPIHTAYIIDANAIPLFGWKYLTILGAQYDPIPNDMYKTERVKKPRLLKPESFIAFAAEFAAELKARNKVKNEADNVNTAFMFGYFF
jgi:hypothetical protein